MTDRGDGYHEQIGDIVEVCGVQVAADLVAHFRGETLYVPHTLDSTHRLSVALGLDRARRLAEHYGGDRIDVPMSLTDESQARRRLVAELREQGHTVAMIARRARCTQRRVWQILASTTDDRQPSLF